VMNVFLELIEFKIAPVVVKMVTMMMELYVVLVTILSALLVLIPQHNVFYVLMLQGEEIIVIV